MLNFTVTDLQPAVPVHSRYSITEIEYVFRFTAPGSIPVMELEANLSSVQRERVFYIAEASGERELRHATGVCACMHLHIYTCVG